MNGYELVILALALSMDSFSAAISKGIELRRPNLKKLLIVSLYFAFFQALMPLLGFFLANILEHFLYQIDHWISFFVLGYLGYNMIKEAKEDAIKCNEALGIKDMVILSIAVSIDAFTVGITYSFLDVDIILATIITYVVTFITTMLGVKIGSTVGQMFHEKALILGGLMLIALGIKILFEHLGIFIL